jgi:hypothetical protein
MGWELEKSAKIAEPAVERWDDVSPEDKVAKTEPALDIFSLSGGVMKTNPQTGNRIDGLLSKMLEHPDSCKYVGDIDKNLDYLFTHLQLDMIDRVAKDATSREERLAQDAPPMPDPVLSLDRSRASV